ncbi:methylmalonyl-CoA mutase family protein [Acuticoccus sp.]|uniref:methylmalonyl-CoA mutase family protein n=1 Tax=Acuticoccus sp. TaxID=1904378 RepID=UPI003B51E95C
MEAWRPLAEKALRGEPLESLDTGTASGFPLRPLYAPTEPAALGRPYHRPWQVVQRVDGPDSAAQARADLENGATALTLVFAGAPSAHGRGLTAATVDALDAALDDIKLELVPLRLEAGARGRAALALLAALVERRGTPPAQLAAGLDPVGAAAAGAPSDFASSVALADAHAAFRRLGVPGTVFLADGRIVAEAGASAATELAFAMHVVATLLRRLDEGGVPPCEALPSIGMALSASEDQFATIAKLRAARRLHALVAQACGSDAPLALHAETSHRMLAYSDPQTNLLRLTIAAFAAGVGGADSVSVLPFDAEGTPFARRLARNIQSLLIEESHVARLDDPGAGAGAVEAYTDALAQAAWARFQAWEGDLDVVASGRLAEAVQADAEAATERLSLGERAIIGVTIHPPASPSAVPSAAPVAPPADTAEAPDGDRFADLVAAAARGATLADLTDGTVPSGPAIAPERAAAAFGG